MARKHSDTAASTAREAASTAGTALTGAFRTILRAIVAIPLLVGRLGAVAGNVGVHLSTLVATLSTWLSDGSSKARVAMEKAKDIDLHDLSFEAPRVVTKQARRRERGRRLGIAALIAGVAGGIGAGVAMAARRRREVEALEEEQLWTQATTEVARPGTVGDEEEVIDVTAADR